jgi:hypothetical protein
LETVSVAAKNNFESSFDNDMLAGCPNLKSVNVDGVSRSFFEVGFFKNLLKPVPQLQTLSARFIDMGDFDYDCSFNCTDVFCQHSNLVSLNLAGNHFSCIPDGCFDCLINLTDLDLSRNRLDGIRSPHDATFSQATQDRLRRLDLSANPYVCDCGYRWLYLWRQRDPDLFSPSTSYTCSGFKDGRSLSGDPPLVLSAQACMFDANTYGLIFLITFFLMVIFLTCMYVFRKRFRVRQMVKRALVGDRATRDRQQGDPARYRYDLFVSYAEEDAGPWVTRYLVPRLEGRKGLRLCVHERDFHPGRPILNSVEDALNVSRQVGDALIHFNVYI